MSKLDELEKTIDGMFRGKYVIDMALLVKQVNEAKQEAAQQSVQSDGAWVCDRCGHNTTSVYCSNCNLPFPPHR